MLGGWVKAYAASFAPSGLSMLPEAQGDRAVEIAVSSWGPPRNDVVGVGVVKWFWGGIMCSW